MSFWNNLLKPFFVMAPMADVTDVAFRALVAARGAPDVFWTEFVSADGLYHTRPEGAPSGRDVFPSDETNPLMRDLIIGEGQHPIVAQIFSSKPEMITYAVKLVAELGFDGVDINMGCPDKSIEKQGCGSAMIKTPEVARAIIRAAKQAALESYEACKSQSEAIPNLSYRTNLVLRESPMPVSVKTRVGYNKESLDEWLPILLEEVPAAITLHLRTRKQMSLVPADWELMKKAVALRDRFNPDVLLIGNGDVESVEQGRKLTEETGCDGIMIGRGMFGNPWVFSGRKPEDTTLAEKLSALIELAHGFEKIVPPKSFAILKKHIKAFATGFDGAAHLRAQLMEAENAVELEASIKKGMP